MSIITLFEKLYGSSSPEGFEKFLSDMVSGLKIRLNFVGVTNRGWIKLDVSGEDEIAAMNLFNEKVGFVSFTDGLKKFQVKRGKIVDSHKSRHELHIDLGVKTSDCYDVVIKEKTLQVQLADGKELEFQNLVDMFCLFNNMNLEVKILECIDEEKTEVEASLSEDQVSFFREWIRNRFDRLIVLGCFLSDVKRAVRYSNHSRDIIRIESLGVLEHAVLCKLGTDAVGLIPKIGRYLKSGFLFAFSPKKIIENIDEDSFNS